MRNIKHAKFEWGGVHPFSYHPIVFNLVPPHLQNKRVVDCGCGKGIWGYLLRATREIGDKGKLIGIDIKKDYLDYVRKYKVYDKLIQSDISSLKLKDNSVDFLICSEVIEHLADKKGEKFLKEVDRVVKDGGRAIITTPSISLETSIEEGPDSHSSEWTPEKFKEKGYKVYGMGIRLSPGINKWYSPLVLALGYFFTPISYFIPSLGNYMIAVKDY